MLIKKIVFPYDCLALWQFIVVMKWKPGCDRTRLQSSWICLFQVLPSLDPLLKSVLTFGPGLPPMLVAFSRMEQMYRTLADKKINFHGKWLCTCICLVNVVISHPVVWSSFTQQKGRDLVYTKPVHS